MKYPALIKKEKDGKYSVSFPDFKGVIASCFGID
jgi:predicted RNase H-like HicB family nuclease